MNLMEQSEAIARHYAEKIIEWENSSIFSYISEMICQISDRGEDPLDYEMVLTKKINLGDTVLNLRIKKIGAKNEQ